MATVNASGVPVARARGGKGLRTKSARRRAERRLTRHAARVAARPQQDER